MEFEETVQNALDRAITKEEALFLFKETEEPDKYLKLFAAATTVREKECGNLFRLDGWMGSNIECTIDPPCRYCRRAIPGHKWESWKVNAEQLKEIAALFKRTGTTTVEIGGGTNPEVAGPTVIEILKVLKESGLNVWVNVGPALEEEHIQEMKRHGVEAITSSFETMNERIFQEIKPGDSLEKRKRLAHLINDNGVPLISVIMVGIGESYQNRVDHLFYLKELKNFHQLAVSWLRIHPGSPLEGTIIPPTPIEAARTVAIGRLIFRDVSINVSDPQHIQLWVMAGANRMVHAGASLHEKGGFSISGHWVGTGVEHIEAGNGYEIMNILPITARYIRDAGMDVEPTVMKAVENYWESVKTGIKKGK
jgi:biotin synthase